MASDPTTSPMRNAGFWMAALMSGLQGLNAVRVAADPTGFATYMGVPIAAAQQAAWVQIYGLRAAFIALLVAALLARRDFAALRWTALAALVMPLGDAWIAFSAGAPPSITGRHLAIAVFLGIASVVLARAARRTAEAGTRA